MIAIYKRELKAYFHTVIGWLFMAANLFVVSLYFVAYNLMYGSVYFANAISPAGFVTMIAVPVLTMRIIAEERKNKTDQLILTAPISVGKIVIGKFLALAAIFTIPILIIGTYPVIMHAFGKVPMLQAYAAILGFYLYGLTCIAVGLFISSITENQVIAAVLSFGVLFVTYIMSGICSLISTDGNILTKFLGSFDFYSRLESFLTGTIEIPAMIYFLSVLIFFLFLTGQSIQKRRWSVSVVHLKNGVFSTGMITVAVVLLIAVNLLAQQLPEKISSIDITSNKLYSLSKDTEQMLDGLNEDITIYVLGTKDTLDNTIKQTLNRYEDASKHIKVEYKDPIKYPNFASQYTDSELQQNSLIVEGSKRSKAIDYSDIYETEVNYQTYSQETTGYDGEGQLTSAISYVTSDNMPKVYLVEGQNEVSLDTSFEAAVKKANIDTETINLMNYDKVPEDAQAILILAPTSDFSKDDAEKVKNYLADGGKAFIIATYTDKDMTQFNSILSEYGIQIQDGIVAENDTQHYYQMPFYILPNIEYSDYTSDIYNSKYIFMPYAQGMTLDEDNEELQVTKLLTTTDKAVSKTNPSSVSTYEAEDGDINGPFTLGAVVEKTSDDKTSRIAVFTSENLFTDSADQYVSGANLQLFSNIMDNMVEHEAAVSIPVKSYEAGSLAVTQSYFILIGILSVVIIPVGMVLAGIIIWVRRRRR